MTTKNSHLTALPPAGGIRLHVSEDLSEGGSCALSPGQLHYLRNVMRCRVGDGLLVFNGRDGEWLGEISVLDKKSAQIDILSRTRPQSFVPDIWLLFAPVKKARLDYMVQKAAEMGVSTLVPVITQFTQTPRLNADRLKANLVEAAEQCHLLQVPALKPATDLDAAVDGLSDRALVFCDEAAGPALTAETRQALENLSGRPVAVLIGPEGGFSPGERQKLRARANTLIVSLGPRILRTDTALVAALSLCQATFGDWVGPH